jgi:hypothetical protein
MLVLKLCMQIVILPAKCGEQAWLLQFTAGIMVLSNWIILIHQIIESNSIQDT